jgi:hypothetical protein
VNSRGQPYYIGTKVTSCIGRIVGGRKGGQLWNFDTQTIITPRYERTWVHTTIRVGMWVWLMWKSKIFVNFVSRLWIDSWVRAHSQHPQTKGSIAPRKSPHFAGSWPQINTLTAWKRHKDTSFSCSSCTPAHTYCKISLIFETLNFCWIQFKM